MDIRQQFRQRRRAVSDADRIAAERNICSSLVSLCNDVQLVAAYAAFDGEPDLSDWFSTTTATIALPKISATQGVMSMHIWRIDDPGTRNDFGIYEPALSPDPVAPETFPIVLVPLVAFDAAGTRLGMGKGYYDRYLSQTVQARRIGIAFECQRSERTLSKQSWDQPLDCVVTETGITHFA